MVKPILVTGLGCAAVLSAWTLRAAPPAKAPANQPATTQAAGDDDTASRVAALERFYADIYSQPLADKNRLSRLVAVLSLSRIDGDPLNKKLIGAMTASDVLVGQLAWEALHARSASLSDADKTLWLAGGFDIAKRGGFPGTTLAPLLSAASQRPAATLKNLPETLLRFVEENDPAETDGKAAYDIAQRAITTWLDPRLVQQLISRMNTRQPLAPRIARLLSGLPNAPTINEADDATKLRGTWARFGREVRLVAPTTMPAYAGKSALLAAPERITNPDDPKWRRDLELENLNLDAVEIAFCVDATGSMEKSNEFVTAYTETVAKLLHIMSDQVRAATIYYRHEIDPNIMRPCCQAVPTKPHDFFTRVLPLTTDPAALVQQMRAQKATGTFSGHEGNGAYAGGITTAMKKLEWAPKGKRIIACTGDAPITPGSEKAMVTLARQAKDEGFLLLFLARDTRAAGYVAPASRAATGLEPILYKTDTDRLAKAKEDEKATGVEAAIARFRGTAFETMTVRVLELTLPVEYRDRVRPLMAAVLPILQAQEMAERASAKVAAK